MVNLTYFAMVFPGQGSQSVGMLNGLVELPVVSETLSEASQVLGWDMTALINEGPLEQLNLTVNTQPAMLAAGVATWRAWLAMNGPMPALLAGHSLGEYTALVAGGALSFADALRLVQIRATLMQDAVPENVGAMAAILGLDDSAIRAVCVDAADGLVLEAVNYNSQGQVVIAGNRLAVERGMLLAKERGAKRALLLPVSVPSHCSLMKNAAESLAEVLADVPLQVPSIPVLHNADVVAYRDVSQIRDALARQLYSSVRWVETVVAMADQGVTQIGECGPGKVLSGLIKRIDDRVNAIAMIHQDSLAELFSRLHQE